MIEIFNKQISVRAVFWGLLVDLLATVFFATIFLVAVEVVFILEAPKSSTFYYVTERFEGMRNIFGVVSAVAYLVFAAAGGYFAGKKAKSDQWLHGVLVGALVIFTGLIPFPSRHSKYPHPRPLWLTVVELACVVPAGLMGGALSVHDGNTGTSRQATSV